VTSHRAEVTWTGDRDDLRAHTVRLGEQEVASSSSSEHEGDPAKADPEELFVGSLSACHMLWFLNLARRERLRVISYIDHAEGEMDGSRFTRVALRPRVSFESEPDGETLSRLHDAAHERCFIANSVSCPVVVE